MVWLSFQLFFVFIAVQLLSGSVVKNPPANEGDVGLIPGSGRSPGGGHGNPLQYFCLENSMLRGAWWASVHGVTQSDTTEQLSAHWRAGVCHPFTVNTGPVCPALPTSWGCRHLVVGMSPVPAYDLCHLPRLSQQGYHQTHGCCYRAFEQ